MALDPIMLEAVVGELRESLRHAAVSKVFQTGSCELVLHLWTGRETRQLLLSADPASARLHLSQARRPHPPAPPRFCQLLRARLTRLLEIERLPGERVVQLRFAGPDGTRATLVLELLGAQANLLLLDAQGRIVDTLLRRSGGGRELRPGQPYREPTAPARHDLLAIDPQPPPDARLEAWLARRCQPMTPLLAADLAAGVDSGLPLAELLATLRERWRARDFAPRIGFWHGEPVLTALGPWFLPLAEPQAFASPSAAIEAFYAGALLSETFAGNRRQLQRLVQRRIERLQRRLEQIDAQAGAAALGDRQRQFGDLLLANLHRLRRGMDAIEVEDWFAEPPAAVTIPLDPLLTPQENAERCYQRQRKSRRALEHAQRRRSETALELEWLQQQAFALDEAQLPTELAEVRRELAVAGLLGAERPERKRSEPATPLRHAVTPGGYRLVWGKGSRGNDEVSRRLAVADDLWFHAHALPGCHLLLRREGRKGAIPEQDVLYAAALAAGYSRGRDAAKVEVMVAEARAVRPLAGGPPGLVTVARYRTVRVAPQRLEEGEGA